jgi:ribosomal protein S18 acetylase RimI-like enzyme
MEPSPRDLALFEARLAFLAGQRTALCRHADRIEVVAELPALATVIPLAETALDPSWPSVTLLPWVRLDWDEKLKANGYVRSQRMAFLERPVEPPIEVRPLEAVVIEQVADLAAADEFAELQTECFMPEHEPRPEQWRDDFRARARRGLADSGLIYLVARSGGAVCGITMMQISRPDAGLYLVGTRAGMRGRGLATKLLREAQNRAVAAGCSTLQLQADTDGGAYGMYIRCGFADRFETVIWRKQRA